jgi:hypothetical protein
MVEPAARALTTHCWTVVRGGESAVCSIPAMRIAWGCARGRVSRGRFVLFSVGWRCSDMCDWPMAGGHDGV